MKYHRHWICVKWLRGIVKKQMKSKETLHLLTFAADYNSCRMTRRPNLCSSHHSPGERKQEETRPDSRRCSFMNHECQTAPDVKRFGSSRAHSPHVSSVWITYSGIEGRKVQRFESATDISVSNRLALSICKVMLGDSVWQFWRHHTLLLHYVFLVLTYSS